MDKKEKFRKEAQYVLDTYPDYAEDVILELGNLADAIEGNSEYITEDFSGDQLYHIGLALELLGRVYDEEDISKIKYILNPNFSVDQMVSIICGLEDELDVSLYADPKFDVDQMNAILIGLQSKVDVTKYADPKYNASQMDMILHALVDELDYTQLLNPELSKEQMVSILNILRINKKFNDNIPIDELVDPKIPAWASAVICRKLSKASAKKKADEMAGSFMEFLDTVLGKDSDEEDESKEKQKEEYKSLYSKEDAMNIAMKLMRGEDI